MGKWETLSRDHFKKIYARLFEEEEEEEEEEEK